MDFLQNKSKLEKIVISALLVALSIALKNIAISINIGGMPIIRIGFHYIPIMFIAITLGAYYGVVASLTLEIMTSIVFNTSGYAPYPGYFLSAVLYGLIPAILYKYIKIENTNKKIIIIAAITNIVLTLGLSTLWAYDMTRNPIFIILISKLIQTPILIFINSVSLIALLPVLERVFGKKVNI